MTAAPDDVIALLRRHGRGIDAASLGELMRGVAAAPESLSGPDWVELVDPGADAELTTALTRWRAELAAADDGLEASPAPAARLAELRTELKRRGLDGFVVPRADEHQGEYVPRRSQRLGGSPASAARRALPLCWRTAPPSSSTAAIRWRYATRSMSPPSYRTRFPEQSAEQWIADNLPKGGRLGFDPWLQTVDGHDRFARACQRAGGSFVPVESNPVDAVWRERPRRRWPPSCRIRLSSPARPARASAPASPPFWPAATPTWP